MNAPTEIEYQQSCIIEIWLNHRNLIVMKGFCKIQHVHSTMLCSKFRRFSSFWSPNPQTPSTSHLRLEQKSRLPTVCRAKKQMQSLICETYASNETIENFLLDEDWRQYFCRMLNLSFTSENVSAYTLSSQSYRYLHARLGQKHGYCNGKKFRKALNTKTVELSLYEHCRLWPLTTNI